MRYDKFSIIHIAFVIIALTLISLSVVVFNDIDIPFGQAAFSGQQQQPPPMGVKILSPSEDDNITIASNSNFEISGTSIDDTNIDCKVSIILNNVKPYQEAIPTGPGGDGDYSNWIFSLTPSYNATINEGFNTLTAKQTCTNPNKFASSDLATHYSVFFNGINDGSSGGNSSAAETPPTTNSISAQQQGEVEIKQQQQQEQSPSSIVTLKTPIKNNDTIAQLSASSSRPTDKSEREKSTITTPTTSITKDGSTGLQTTKTMTFTIYQEGKLSASNNKTKQITSTDVASASSSQNVLPSAKKCNENLPISQFSAIGDDGHDAIPQNAFDNNLETRWSHDSVGSWILIDLGNSKAVCFVDIAWYRGNERSYDFIISLSDDGINFKDVHAGTSTGNNLTPERYSVMDNKPSLSNQDTAAAMARYVRITVNGNTDSDTEENQWAAIAEIDVNGSFDGKSEAQIPLTAETQGRQSSTSSSLEEAGERAGDTMILKISGIYEDQNKNKNSGTPPPLDPSRLEGTLSIIDSATNKKIEEYDLAPINIVFTQLFKKITVTTGIDDPIMNGTVTSTLKFPSPIDFSDEGNYTSESRSDEGTAVESRGTIGNMLLAKIDGEQTYSILGDAKGSITIRSLTAS
ncbi:MAG TPA: discoidin domain-containing protein [Nitrososphaeraceae archaeon]|nr:discoidin domain-containing protein [Nitrososphaeraceae archaeon]